VNTQNGRSTSIQLYYLEEFFSRQIQHISITKGFMRSKRQIFAGTAAATVLGYAVLSVAQPAGAGSCGLGPPPGSPGFVEFKAGEAAEAKRNGFLLVCEANLARYEIASKLQPLASAMAGLAFRPVDLAGTPFSQITSLGGMAESVTNVKSRFYRGFRTADGHTVTLFEHDMSADGSQIFRNPTDEPEKVNGLPARLDVMQASSGKAVSIISWKEGRRYYELWMNANVTLGQLRPQLFALSAALPKSVPARKHEPELRPFVVGPDGVPQEPPPPATLSDEQMRALIKRTNLD
jgi:hypothetical protein